MLIQVITLLPLLALQASALASNASIGTQTSTALILANDRLVAQVGKSKGVVTSLYLDGQNLLGVISGSTGIGPYLDCYCTPSGAYTPGSVAPKYELINGVDSTGTKYGGIVMNETYAATGQTLYQYWFLREGETGLHTFSRYVSLNKIDDVRVWSRNLFHPYFAHC